MITFINDWRDTIYYSAALIAVGFACVFEGVWAGFLLLSYLMWSREICRALWWFVFHLSHPKCRFYFMSACALMLINDILRAISYLIVEPNKYFIFHVFIVLADSAVVASYFILTPLTPKWAARLYWHDLFDWPRKQKPPTHRWKTFCDKIKQLMANMAPRPAIVPQATYEQI